jgi:hypothetical protein
MEASSRAPRRSRRLDRSIQLLQRPKYVTPRVGTTILLTDQTCLDVSGPSPTSLGLSPRFPITATRTEATCDLEADNHRLVSAAGPLKLSA